MTTETDDKQRRHEQQQQQQQQGENGQKRSVDGTREDDSHGEGTFLEAASHVALFVFSHFICYYLWWAATFNGGRIGNPFPLQPDVVAAATPNAVSVKMYAAIILGQLIGAAYLPGPVVKGFKIPEEGGRRLDYRCNALASWYIR